MLRPSRCIGLVALLLLVSGGNAAAQRRGFIIGLGVGPGLTFGDPATQLGATTDFKIGAMVGESMQLYYRNLANFGGSGVGYDLESAGISGLGATYQLRGGFRLNGVVGLSTRVGFNFDDSTQDADLGFGVGGGIGYEFADRWVVSLDGLWGRPAGDYTMLNVALTIGILSH